MKIFILGSEGFIGKAACVYFLERGYNVTGCDLYDINNANYHYIKLSRRQNNLSEILRNANYDYFINCAGSGNVPLSITDPFLDFELNTVDVFRILDTIRANMPFCKYIQISSAAVYGNPKSLPVKETDICHPVSPYGFHKLMSEIICKEFYELYNLKVVIVRPFSVYGPGLKKQLFWDMFQKYQTGQRVIEVWGSGSETRDFIYIDDLICLLECIMRRGQFCCEIYNAGSGMELRIGHALTQMFAHLDKNVELRFNNKKRPGDPINWRADISFAASIGYSQKITFEQGIKNVIEWYKSLN